MTVYYIFNIPFGIWSYKKKVVFPPNSPLEKRKLARGASGAERDWDQLGRSLRELPGFTEEIIYPLIKIRQH